MTDQPRKLVTFAISHYCEAARWTLDWCGIEYTEIGWPPGLHRILAKRAGAPGASVPILFDGASVVQSTGRIFDWAEEHAGKGSPSLQPGLPATEAREIETRLNKVIGVHVRRLVYAHVLPDRAHHVKPMLFANTSPAARIAGLAMWPLTKKLIIKGYRTDGNARQESRAVLDSEFDWLDGLLAGRGDYLDGSACSRLDILAASLLAPVTRPPEMPIYRQMELPRELTAHFDDWAARPAIRWGLQMYKRHRNWVSAK